MPQHKRSKHTGEHAVNCPVCITKAEQARMPWQASYLDVFAATAKNKGLHAQHKAAMRRNERNQAMRDLGMVKTPCGWE